jgi:hypothetical protein
MMRVRRARSSVASSVADSVRAISTSVADVARLAREVAPVLFEPRRERGEIAVLLLEVAAVEEALLRDEEEQHGRDRAFERSSTVDGWRRARREQAQVRERRDGRRDEAAGHRSRDRPA